MAARSFLRAEVRTNWQCVSGSSVVCHIADAISCEAQYSTLITEQQLTLAVPVTSLSAPDLLRGRVVVVQFDDGTNEEWRIVQRDGGDGGQSDAVITVTCAHPVMDLAELPYLTQLSSDGLELAPAFGGVDLTPDEYLDTFVIGDPQLSVVAPWITKGTINPTMVLSLDVDHTSPLAFVQSMVSALLTQRIPCEFDFRKVGRTGYAIDLLGAIGQDAADVRLDVGTELASISEKSDDTPRATWLMPLGADKTKMRRAAWLGAVISSTVVALRDPDTGVGPTIIDDQLLGRALVHPATGARLAITASAFDETTGVTTVTVSNTTGLDGQLIEVRADTSGLMLDALTIPGDHPKFGSVTDTSMRGDYNQIPNAYKDTWTSAVAAPDGWMFSGSHTTGSPATLSRVTPAVPTLAAYGARVQDANSIMWDPSQNAGHTQGLLTPASTWFEKTAASPFVSFKVAMDVRSLRGVTSDPAHYGVRVQLERVGATAGTLGAYDVPIANIVTDTDIALNSRVEMAVDGVVLPQSGQYLLRVYEVSKPGAPFTAGSLDVEFYEFQLTQTATNVDWLQHSAANSLWTLASQYLASNIDGLSEYTVNQIDLARQNPEVFAHTVPSLGCRGYLTNATRTIRGWFRCVKIATEFVDGAQGTTLTFAQQASPLTRILAAALAAGAFGTTSSGTVGGSSGTSSAPQVIVATPPFTQASFSGAGARPLLPKVAETSLSLTDFPTATGDTPGTGGDDTLSFQNWSAAVQARGGGAAFVPPGTYNVSPTKATAQEPPIATPLCQFTNLNGLVIDTAGVTINDTNTYGSTEEAVLFAFENCHHIGIPNLRITSPSPTPYLTQHGVICTLFTAGCTEIDGSLITEGCQRGWFFTKEWNDPDSDRCSGIRVTAKATDTQYPFLARFSGDAATVHVNGTGCGRNYYAIGVSGHKAFVRSKNQLGATIWGAFNGVGCSDMELDYTDVDSTSGAGTGIPVILQFSDTVAATFKNLTLHLTINNANGYFSHSFLVNKVDSNNAGIRDIAGRSHILDGLEIDGSSLQANGVDHVAVFGYFPPGGDTVRKVKIDGLTCQSLGNSRIALGNLLTAASGYAANAFDRVTTPGGLYVHPSFRIVGATNATPIVITTDEETDLCGTASIAGMQVTITGVGGNTAANTTCYVKRLSSTTYGLYTNSTLTTGLAGNGAYTSGGAGIVTGAVGAQATITNCRAAQFTASTADNGLADYAFCTATEATAGTKQVLSGSNKTFWRFRKMVAGTPTFVSDTVL